MTNQNNENREQCKSIAKTLEAIANGEIFICPECGEWIRGDECEYNETMDVITCRNCGAEFSSDDAEQVSMFDYLEDVFDIEYRVGSDKEYRSARIMIACGGPNIYIDTKNALVQLYWWTDYAEFPISYEARDVLDEYMEELFNC